MYESYDQEPLTLVDLLNQIRLLQTELATKISKVEELVEISETIAKGDLTETKIGNGVLIVKNQNDETQELIVDYDGVHSPKGVVYFSSDGRLNLGGQTGTTFAGPYVDFSNLQVLNLLGYTKNALPSQDISFELMSDGTLVTRLPNGKTGTYSATSWNG